jgi:hypothetical protein
MEEASMSINGMNLPAAPLRCAAAGYAERYTHSKDWPE